MAISNPIVSFQSGAQISATTSGGLGGGTSRSEKRFKQGTLRSTAISTIGWQTGTLTAGGTVEINLYSGALLSVDGTTAVPLRQILYVDLGIETGSAGGYLRIGGAASDANALWFADATDKALVYPNGPMFMQGNPTTSVAVDNTHKNILIANPHATLSVTYVFRVAGLLV